MYSLLKKHKVTTVQSYYDGENDDGCVKLGCYKGKKLVDVPDEVTEIIIEFIYNCLPSNWKIEHGSFGFVVITVKTKKAKFTHNKRYVETKEFEV